MERCGEIDASHQVIDYEDLLEQRLVELASTFRRRPSVDLSAGFQHGQCLVQVGLDQTELAFTGSQDSFGLFGLLTDAGLFFAQQIQRDGIGVVGLEQLAPLRIKSLKSDLLSGDFLLGQRPRHSHVCGHLLGDLVQVLLAHLDLLVVVGDTLLDRLGRDVALSTFRALLVAGNAEEVLVDAAMAATRRTQAQTSTTVAAVQTADQIVLVLGRPI